MGPNLLATHSFNDYIMCVTAGWSVMMCLTLHAKGQGEMRAHVPPREGHLELPAEQSVNHIVD